MIFAIGLIAYLAGQFVFRVYTDPFEVTIGEAIGVALILAGFATMVISTLILAWRYLP